VTVAEAVEKAEAAIAAAGCDEPRGDAEALVADALGIDVGQLSGNGAGELPADVAAELEQRVARRAEHEPLAYILGRETFRGLEIAVDPRVLIPRRETGLLVEVGSSCRRAPGCTRSAPAPAPSRLAPAQRAPRPARHRLRPLAGGAEVARENAGAARHRPPVTVEEGLPDEDLGAGDRPRPRQPPVRDRLDDLRALAEIRASPRSRHRRLRRGRPRRDPRRARRDPGRLDGRLRARHPSRAGDARDARRAGRAPRTDYMGGERVTVGHAP
jgi:hypothetical protein